MFLAAVFILLSVSPIISPAQPVNQCTSPLPNQDFCTALMQSNTASTAVSGFKGLVVTSFLIMLVLGTALGLAFGIGYAFRIDRLIEFVKMEAGEMLITIITLSVILGIVYGSSGGNISSASSPFISSCQSLTTTSIAIFQASATYLLPLTMLFNLMQNIQVRLEPIYFGISFSPFAGFAFLNSMTDMLGNFASMISGLMLGISVFLGLVYIIFPIFLYVGIFLRSVPFTRAAGGALIGLFIGFYIVFPLLLSALLGVAGKIMDPTSTQCSNNWQQFVSSVGHEALNVQAAFATAAASILDPMIPIQYFMVSAVEPALYALFSLIISIMVAFDFSELMGDMLGAESLSSSQTLRRII